MRARDVMTTPVITASADSTVKELVDLMLKHRISAVPIVDSSGGPMGIVSEGDLIRRSEIGTEQKESWWLWLVGGRMQMTEDFIRAHGSRAADIMSRDVIAVGPDATLAEIASTLERRRIKRVPVVDNGKIVGIVSRANILRALASASEKAGLETASADDNDIRSRLMGLLEQQGWADLSRINIVVSDKVVHLWGSVSSAQERRALVVAAESVGGVKRVADHTISSLEY
ncbi:MAG: CBS domain-containing protein [Hyphomicrobiales bacterium]